MLWEIAYENSKTSGRALIHAETIEHALALFDEQWSQYGDAAPSRKIVGLWKVEWLVCGKWSDKNPNNWGPKLLERKRS